MDCTQEELRKEWIAALKSGEYKQARDHLQWDGGYCCLGVACLVAEKHGVHVNKTEAGSILGQSLASQPEVRKAFGFVDTSGGYLNVNHSPASANDAGWNFEKIAEVVEENQEFWE